MRPQSFLGAIALLPLFFFYVILPSKAFAVSTVSPSGFHFLLRVENSKDGKIILVDLSVGKEDKSNTFVLGRVLRPATTIRTQSFRASLYGERSVVVASAVNAIHIKLYSQSHLGKGVSLSIYPEELFGKGFKGAPERLLDYVIYTDIPAGRYLFGGSFSPIPGSKVTLVRNGTSMSLGFGFEPRDKDALEIEMVSPDDPISRFIFENKKRGKVIAERVRGIREVVAFVEKPLSGVGRFGGTELTPPGAVRAVHSAVIDISTSKRGEPGGFQITPASHTVSGELMRANIRPQYMLIGPVRNGRIESTPPLFRDYLFPRISGMTEPPLVNLKGERVAVAEINRLPRIRVLGDFGTGLSELPVASGRNDNALIGLRTLVLELFP